MYYVYLYVIAGVDETVVVTLKFSKNRMAMLTCSSGVELPNDAIIAGTNGNIRVGLRDQIIFKSLSEIQHPLALCTFACSI